MAGPLPSSKARTRVPSADTAVIIFCLPLPGGFFIGKGTRPSPAGEGAPQPDSYNSLLPCDYRTPVRPLPFIRVPDARAIATTTLRTCSCGSIRLPAWFLYLCHRR